MAVSNTTVENVYRNGTKNGHLAEDNTENFTIKFRVPIVFLSSLVLITGLLVGLYFALKRNICNCQDSKIKEDDPETQECRLKHEEVKDEHEIVNVAETSSKYNLDKFYEEDDGNFYVGDLELDTTNDEVAQASNDVRPDAEEDGNANSEVKSTANEQEPSLATEKEREEDLENGEIRELDQTITKSSFVPGKTKESLSFRSALRRIAKPKKLISAPDKDSFEEYPLVESNERYGSLHSVEPSMASSNYFTLGLTEDNVEEVWRGRLQVSVRYDEEDWKIGVWVRQGTEFQCLGKGRIYWQVHVAFLPHKKYRFKTKFKPTSTPVFNEIFEVADVPKQALSQIAVRFRVYRKVGRAGINKFTGETVVNLDCLEELEDGMDEWNASWYDIQNPKTERPLPV